MEEHEEKTPEELGWSFNASRGTRWGKTDQYSYHVTGFNHITGQTANQTSVRAHSEEYAILLFKIWLPKPSK